MTREEAIRWLNCVKEEVEESEGTMIYISMKEADALGMAIEALSEPINCIKRSHYTEVEDETGVHGRCEMDRENGKETTNEQHR